jgi:hypothetical protein
MNYKPITILVLIILGLCLLGKFSMKRNKNVDMGCNIILFIAIVLLTVNQLLNEETFDSKRSTSVKGILALDIDGTTECPDNMTDVKRLTEKAYALNYKPIIITARSAPYGIDLDSMGLLASTDIYYNPPQLDIPATKSRQLHYAHTKAGLIESELHKSILVDNDIRNIRAVRATGFTGIHATCKSLKPVLKLI